MTLSFTMIKSGYILQVILMTRNGLLNSEYVLDSEEEALTHFLGIFFFIKKHKAIEL